MIELFLLAGFVWWLRRNYKRSQTYTVISPTTTELELAHALAMKELMDRRHSLEIKIEQQKYLKLQQEAPTEVQEEIISSLEFGEDQNG